MRRLPVVAVLAVPLVLASCRGGTGSKSSSPQHPSACTYVAKLDDIADIVARADVHDPVAFKKTLATAVSQYVANVRGLRAVAPVELHEGLDRVEADVQQFRFEAAVMGGTPILRLLAEDLAGSKVLRVRGIVNGTTNYILTEMAMHGTAYEAALADAQAAGYAEADPTSDVEGGDSADKLVILARLAFGVWLDRNAVATAVEGGRPGITGVTPADLAAAAKRGYAIRLLATARRADDGSIQAGVMPTAVDVLESISGINGVRNRVDVETDRLGSISLEGPGAGGHATAGAVLADLGALIAGHGSTWGSMPSAPAGFGRDLECTLWFTGPSGARYPVAR